MMLCQDVQNLIDEHLAGTLEPKLRKALVNHLKTCPACHRAVEEARLADMVLHQAAQLPPPPDLAAKINSAVRFRLLNRPRPLHERALGSPAFLATCASLLCGAIICLSAIMRVGSVPVDTADQPARAAAVAAKTVAMAQPARFREERVVRQRHPVLKNVSRVARQPAVLPLPRTEARAVRVRLRSLDGALVARADQPLTLCNARHDSEDATAVVLVPAVQRTSLPAAVYPASAANRAKSGATAMPIADKSELVPAIRLSSDASEISGDEH